MTVERLAVEIIPAFNDNYIYLFIDPVNSTCAAVDPGVAAPVLERVARMRLRLTHVLVTHHHHDHVGGVLDLKEATGCRVVGNALDGARIPGLDEPIEPGGRFVFADASALVIDVRGHTIGHIAFWFAEQDALFCGDTLFSLGCGRLFEGTPGEMWRSLSALRALPPTARVYCGHEYTLANAAFALTIEPRNSALIERAAEARRLRAEGSPTLPALMGIERETNPFLRADEPSVQSALDLHDADPITVFAELRARKNRF